MFLHFNQSFIRGKKQEPPPPPLRATLKESKQQHAPAGNVKTEERENWAANTSGVRRGPRLPSRLCSRLSAFPCGLTSGHAGEEAELQGLVQFDRTRTAVGQCGGLN